MTIVYDDKGIVILMLSKFIGFVDSNYAELMAVREVIAEIISRGTSNP